MPVAPSTELVERLRATLPEPPSLRRERLQESWGFSDHDMQSLINAGRRRAGRGDGRGRRRR